MKVVSFSEARNSLKTVLDRVVADVATHRVLKVGVVVAAWGGVHVPTSPKAGDQAPAADLDLAFLRILLDVERRVRMAEDLRGHPHHVRADVDGLSVR